MQGTLRECLAWLADFGEADKRYEVKEVRKRRTLTQNAYYWQMLNKLARVLRVPDSELHKNMLREYGQCEVMSVSLDVPVDDYFQYFDVIGVDYIDGEERRMLKVYKGSSRMNSSEFTHLIQGMREECEAQGIDVLTPEEIARMKFTEGK